MLCTNNSSSSKTFLPTLSNRADSGVTTIEFSLIALVFFGLLLTLMDFALYLATRSVLNSAANKALSLAAVTSGLDADCTVFDTADTVGKKNDCNQQRLDSMKGVLQSARNSSLGTLVHAPVGSMLTDLLDGTAARPAVEFQIVKSGEKYTHRAYLQKGTTTNPVYIKNETASNDWVNPGVALRDVLQNQPMEMHIRGTYRSLSPWLPDLPLDGHAVGFREPRFISSYPAYVDCRGKVIPVGSTAPASVGYCPCVFDPGNGALVEGPEGKCACKNPLITEGSGTDSDNISCKCTDPNLVYNSTLDKCVCPTPTCKAGEVQNPKTCGCEACPGLYGTTPDGLTCNTKCPAAVLANGGANCGGNQYFEPSKCACLTCPQFKEANGDHTACVCKLDPVKDCPSGSIGNTAACGCSSCSGQSSPNAEHTSCICNITADQCPKGTILSTDSGGCQCKPCGSGQQANSSQTACEPCTLVGSQCNDNQVANLNVCQCQGCPGNFSPNDANTQCICRTNPSNCGKNEYLNVDSCTCVPCSGEFEPNAGQTACECKSDASKCKETEVWDAANCKCAPCPNNTTSGGAHLVCECKLRPEFCAGSTNILDVAKCECKNCPTGQQEAPSGTYCECPISKQTDCRGGQLQSDCSCNCPSGEVSVPGGGCAPSVCCPPGGGGGADCRQCNWGSSGGSIIEGL